jgi:hypothetical protein
MDSDTIVKFAPDGTDQGVFTGTGLNEPFGIMFDSVGNLYAANTGNDTIEKFFPQGRSGRIRLDLPKTALPSRCSGQATGTSKMRRLRMLGKVARPTKFQVIQTRAQALTHSSKRLRQANPHQEWICQESASRHVIQCNPGALSHSSIMAPSILSLKHDQ